MHIFRETASYKNGPCHLTIGNFDGLHRGHLSLISLLKAAAAQDRLPTAILTFEPSPSAYFYPEHAPARLNSLGEKLRFFQKLAIDYVFICRFNALFAQMSAIRFLEELVNQLHIRHIFVGENFYFGAKKMGNIACLRKAANRYGFEVTVVPLVYYNHQLVSSTTIRQALHEGRLEEASYLLGRPYSMSGKVIAGDKQARRLGYPTANIHVKHSPLPLMGVFCVVIYGLDKAYQGVANLGFRPTLKQDTLPILEVFIFNFHRSIYQAHLRIDFLKKLRDEMKFSNIATLCVQIEQDIAQAKDFFLNWGEDY